MKKTIFLFIVALSALTFQASKATAQDTISSYSGINHWCDSEVYTVITNVHTTGYTIMTYFGDGTNVTHPLDSMGRAFFGHIYSSPGVYTVKHVLHNGGIPVDSINEIDTVILGCHTISLTQYLDYNSNCTYDSGDGVIWTSYPVEIDSAGIPVDTITATSFYYYAYGPSGTIYTFKIITPPFGTVASCPSSGIVYDTIGTGNPNKAIALACATTSSFDLLEDVYIYGPGRHTYSALIAVRNVFCTGTPATLTYTFSPKYNFTSATPTPASVSGNVITWTFPPVSLPSLDEVEVHFDVPSTYLTPGDTIQNKFVLTPITGDLDTTNNIVIRVDTVKSSYDPNEKSVMPQGIISAGTRLDYKVLFENTGNAPAVNIHVQDTLSDNVDINTFKLESSTAPVYTFITKDASGHNVVKFDFQNINLLDSTHHGQCDGGVTFTINTKPGLANGTLIDNRAGIYFDDNNVVMTNTVQNVIGVTTGVTTLTNAAQVEVYPNPVNNELTVKANSSYNTLTISNIMGQILITQPFSNAQTKVNVSTLPSGMYFLTLKGDSGVKVQKFEKL